VLSIETGCVLREFKQPIQRAEPTVVVEQFHQRLLLKQVRPKPANPKQDEAPLSAPKHIHARPLPPRATTAPLAILAQAGAGLDARSLLEPCHPLSQPISPISGVPPCSAILRSTLSTS
jgi:hypothetical protein